MGEVLIMANMSPVTISEHQSILLRWFGTRLRKAHITSYTEYIDTGHTIKPAISESLPVHHDP